MYITLHFITCTCTLHVHYTYADCLYGTVVATVVA